MKYKDYYGVLGVSRSASSDEIKKAYRRLARKYHPDVSKEKDAEEHFKAVNEAYDILSDPQKRAAYDQLGSFRGGQDFRPPPDWGARFGQGGFGQADLGGMDFADLFSQMFGMGAGAGSQRRGTGGLRGRDVEARLQVTLEEAYSGGEHRLNIAVPGQSARVIKVRIPPGVLSGRRLRVRGKGEASMHGEAGDLLIDVEVLPHPLFELDGQDILLDLPILPWEAVFGTTVTVPTLSGAVRLKVPAGAKSGQKLRLSGRGMPGDARTGDFYGVIRIVVPDIVSDDEQALYRQLAAVNRFNPRPRFPND